MMIWKFEEKVIYEGEKGVKMFICSGYIFKFVEEKII